MASGKAHAVASLVLSIPLSMGVGIATGDAGKAIAAGVGCGVLGIFLTPDLDQEGTSKSETWLVQWTFGLGYLWQMIWYAYAWAIPHRSPWSHLPGFGTTIRAVYLACWLWLLDNYGWRIELLPPLLSIKPELWLSAFVGLCVSDTMHMVMDVLPKRKKNSKKR